MQVWLLHTQLHLLSTWSMVEMQEYPAGSRVSLALALKQRNPTFNPLHIHAELLEEEQSLEAANGVV